MKKFYFLILFLLLASFANAQIEGVYFGKHGSEFDILSEAAKKFSDKEEYDKAINCYHILDSIYGLREEDFTSYMRCYYLLIDYDNLFSLSERWLNQFDKNSTKKNKHMVYGFLADAYYFSGDYKNAIVYYKRLINVDDRDRRAVAWEKFMLGRAEFALGETGEMKRSCTSAAMDLCLYFGVNITNIWDDEVKNDELGLVFYALALMLYDTPDCEDTADAAMTLSGKCGFANAVTYCEQHKVPCKPYKSKAFSRSKK